MDDIIYNTSMKKTKTNHNETTIISASFYVVTSFISGLVSFITAMNLSRGKNVDPALSVLSLLFTPISWFFLVVFFALICYKINEFHEKTSCKIQVDSNSV